MKPGPHPSSSFSLPRSQARTVMSTEMVLGEGMITSGGGAIVGMDHGRTGRARCREVHGLGSGMDVGVELDRTLCSADQSRDRGPPSSPPLVTRTADDGYRGSRSEVAVRSVKA